MKANKKIIILAVIIGLITVFALNYYLTVSTDETPLAARQAEMVSVVVAESTIPQHTRITAEMLTTTNLPEDAVHPETLRNVNDAVGGISRSDIVRGEQVLSSRVATEEMRASLAYRIPETYRAISIPMGEVAGVAGYISPGDRVDILISYTIFIEEGEEEEEVRNILTTYTTLQNILVLASGGITREQDDEERNVVGNITLAVNPEQAEVLAYATLQGTFHLTLRSPLDEEIMDLEYYNIENFETFRER